MCHVWWFVPNNVCRLQSFHKIFVCRDKATAIIKGILAPYSHQQLLKELSLLPYSISIDASNHKETKLFPVVVRFFSPNDDIKVRLLKLKNLSLTCWRTMEWKNTIWFHFALIMRLSIFVVLITMNKWTSSRKKKKK